MTLFQAYTGMVEEAIEAHLQETFDGALGLADFEQLLADRMAAASAAGDESAAAEELSGDVFDVLMSLGDYDEFRSMMLSYREQVEYEAGKAAGAVVAGGALAVEATPAAAASPVVVDAATAGGSATAAAPAAAAGAPGASTAPSTAAAAPAPAAAPAAGGAAAGRRAGGGKAATGGGDSGFVADFGGLSIMGTSISGKR